MDSMQLVTPAIGLMFWTVVIFVLFMDLIEVLVAFLQAYIFTLLTSLFIGLAIVDHH
jgi:F0F1-type ATP synthase membrane subunit a